MIDDDEYWIGSYEDLIEAISQLEKRIIQLEVELSKKRLVMNDDSWYWDH